MNHGRIRLRPACSTSALRVGCAVVVAGCFGAAAERGRLPRASNLRPDYDPASHSADPVEEFGVSRGDPIDRGFFFHENRYIEGPYVVERRGLAVCINGIPVGPTLEWPPYDRTVDQDPGDPPPGSSPFDETPPGRDPREDYWHRKWRYLEQHYAPETAFKEMVRTYRKCRELRSVRTSWRRQGEVTVVDRSGRELPMIYMCSCRGEGPLTRDGILARAQLWKSDYENALAAGSFIGQKSGFASEIGGPRAVLPMMGILLSRAGAEEKIAALERLEILGRLDEESRQTVRRFTYSAELAEKVRRMKRDAR